MPSVAQFFLSDTRLLFAREKIVALERTKDLGHLKSSSAAVPASPPHRIYEAWRAGTFVLLTCDEQLDESRRVTRYEKLRAHIQPATAGTLLNELRKVVQRAGKLPKVKRSPDAGDDYQFALAQVADADILVTSDRSGMRAIAT